jgi:DNA polymerase-3 subunit delta'
MAGDSDDLLRHDRIEGWPAPEEQPEWFGNRDTETALLDAYRSGRMHHAWMLGGPKGIGKATLAFRLARFILANPDPKSAAVVAATDLSVPENHPAFRKVATRAHPNLLVIERSLSDDKKRFKTQLAVDDVRKTVSFFGSTGGEDNWRIAVVDAADDLNASSANALLKILEEPPARSLFLIISHAPGRALATIRSRSRRLDIPVLEPDVIAGAIRAHGLDGMTDADLALVSDLAEGSLRRAIFLTEGGGLEVHRALATLFARLPEMDMDAAHALADKVAGRSADDAWVGFRDTLAGWLNRRVRGAGDPGGADPPPAVLGTPLERWAEVWENLRESTETADEYNLDRKRTVLSILMAVARAARM